MQLISLQKDTVNKILDLYNPENKIVCEFKAPTGSGKTLMASYFISKMIEEHNEDNFIFVIATPSSSSLPLFFEQKINKYKVDLPYSKFEVEYIQSPSSSKTDKNESIDKTVPEKNKVYIFGKSSFGKGRILSEYKIIDDFILSAKDKGYKLIYIRDEAHIGGEQEDKGQEAVNFENLMNTNASFVLKMTATPNMKDQNTKKIFLKESDLNDESLNEGKYLLKTNLVSLLDKDIEDREILSHAISKFKDIKKEYEELNIGIHPAMLIQVDNNSSNKEKAKIFEDNLSVIKQQLQNAGLKWVQYFGNNDKDSNRVYKDNFTLDDITKNNNEIDVVIFKIGPATGWDIPRACMLLQLRNISSVSLNIQTIGRIKRNPYPNLEKNPITDKYYIYSNAKDCDLDLKPYNYQVQEKYQNEHFLSIHILNRKELINQKPQSEFIKKLDIYLKENENFIIQEFKEFFIEEGQKYKKVINKVGIKEIYTTISNPFIFLRDYKRKVITNKSIYYKIKETVEIFAKKIKVQKEFIFTILFENKRKNEILDLINQTIEFRPIYKINEEFYDPKSYIEIYDSNKEDEKISSKKEYLFKINEDTETLNRQPLDSKGPEHFVFEKLDDFISNCENVKLWAKNLTSSNIFGEYLDDFNNIRKSYFDFVLKFANRFYLYIEVKGIPDINENKTKYLEKSYIDYFKTKNELFSHKLAICVWRVDNKKQIKSSVYYDKNTIKEDLNLLTAEELLKIIPNLKN